MTQMAGLAIRPARMVATIRSRAAAQPTWVRTVVGALLLALLVPLMFLMVTAPAHAEGDDKDKQDYSLYKLGSNANVYFTNRLSPEHEDPTPDSKWAGIYKNPAEAGSMMGYADDGNFVNWLFSVGSGASHTVKLDVFPDGYQGMKGYAQFGAANADLGLDKMYSSAGFDPIVRGVGGALIWLLYILAIGVAWLFWAFIQILQFLNPFLWFHKGMAAVSPAYKNFADGMVTTNAKGQETVHVAPSGLDGVESFIADWYGTLVSMSWGVLVPLFIGFLLLGLVFFKKMNRGSALKKLVVRMLFLAFGLPLIGGMYTSILSQFSEDLGAQNSGPTQVVASTYIDFENWMNKDRLHVPDNASITWDPATGHVLPISTFSVRNTALAINKQAHPEAFANLDVATKDKNSSASAAWANAPSINGKEAQQSDEAGAGMVIDMLWRYMTHTTVKASDFESKIQSEIQSNTSMKDPQDYKKHLFLDSQYQDADKFGEQEPVGGQTGGPNPEQHPLFSTNHAGLTLSPVDGTSGVVFTSSGTTQCDFRVVKDGTKDPLDCNLAPMAAYNYQNTEFHADSMTIYSGQRAASGFTQSFHSSVAQVGTGASAFMYWANTAVLLLCIVLIGVSYGLGMLFGSLKRGISSIAAVPFATAGSIAGIAKVVIYGVALILEVLVTVFLYQFVSKLLISLPQIIEDPIANWLKPSGGTAVNVLANVSIGSAVIVVMIFVSILLTLGITITLMRVRGSVLKAMDEAVTKLVDKFMETNTPPKTGGGLMPAMAGGLGAGAGSAVASRFNGGKNAAAKSNTTTPSQTDGKPTNAGGTNGRSLEAGQRKREQGALTARGNSDDDGNAGRLNGAKGGPQLPGGPGSTGTPRALPAGSGAGASGSSGPEGSDGANGADGAPSDGPRPGGSGAGPAGNNRDDRGAALGQGTTTTASDRKEPGARSADDRQLARRVGQQGGLTQLGIGSGGTGGKALGGKVNTDPRNGQPSQRTGGQSRSSGNGQKAELSAPQRQLPVGTAGTWQDQAPRQEKPAPATQAKQLPAAPSIQPMQEQSAARQTQGGVRKDLTPIREPGRQERPAKDGPKH